jgi:hypothetical protein
MVQVQICDVGAALSQFNAGIWKSIRKYAVLFMQLFVECETTWRRVKFLFSFHFDSDD